MDLLNFHTVWRRHWLLLLVGTVVGAIVLVVTLFSVDRTASPPVLQPKSFTQYKLEMQLLVVDPLFALGRAGRDPEQPDLFQKTIALSTTYAELLTSDAVLSSAKKKVGPTDIQASSENLQNSPIILLTLEGTDSGQMRTYGKAMAESLQRYLQEEQEQSGIDKYDRMSVRLISVSNVQATSSRKWELGLLAFATPVALALGLAMMKDRSEQLAVLEQNRL